MGEFTIVTDFFDVGRGQDSNKALARTKEKYMEEFAYWARIQNKMIVYTDSESAVEIKKIREGYGLLEKTVVIEINDVFELQADIFARMKKVSEIKSFRKFRWLENAFSNNPRYNYLWMMKYYFMSDALDRGLLGESVAWVDFGFDHGGTKFYDQEDFNFTWSYDVKDKIHLFCLSDPNELCGIDTLQFLVDCVMGNMTILPRDKVHTLWKLVKEAAEWLLTLDCVDDDQMLLLMVYKRYPELFEIHITDWSLSMKICGGDHMKVREVEKQNANSDRKKRIYKIKSWIRRTLWMKYDPKIEYLDRTMERIGKYY